MMHMAVTVKKVMVIKDRIEEVMSDLNALLEEKEEVLDNAENRVSPNEEDIERLQFQVDVLRTASDHLEGAAGELEEYE